MVLVVKNLPANAGDTNDADLIPRSGRSPRGGRGNPLQISCLENPMDRGAWWAIVYQIRSDQSLSHVRLFATPWIAAHQASVSITNSQSTQIHGPITSWEIYEDTMETVRKSVFLGSKITADGDCSHEIKRYFLLGRKIMTNLDSKVKAEALLCQQSLYT